MINNKRRGFTLVELLIVIVVIGILAGGMMLASGSATESAKASVVLSGLRGAKGAALDWFVNRAGSPDPVPAVWSETNTDYDGPFESIKRGMDNHKAANDFLLRTIDDGRVYYFVGIEVDNASIAQKVFHQGGARGVWFAPRTDGAALVSSDNESCPDGVRTVYILVK